MKKMFRRRKLEGLKDPVEARFDSMMDLVRDLSKADYRRLKKAMDSGYEAYQIVGNLEIDDLDSSEYVLRKEEK